MDIREVLQALDAKDRQLWSECRTAMRKVYLTAHNKVIGLADYEAQDDAFMDLIDIKLALLFDRGGRIVINKQFIGDDDASKIENDLIDKDNELKKTLATIHPINPTNFQDRELKMKVEAGLIPSSNLPNNEWK